MILGKHWFTEKWRMLDSYIIVFKSLILLGSDIKSKSLHKRIGYLCIFLSGMILYWLWEAMLISYFSFPTKLLPFNTLEEFVANTDNKVNIEVVWKPSFHYEFYTMFNMLLFIILFLLLLMNSVDNCKRFYAWRLF